MGEESVMYIYIAFCHFKDGIHIQICNVAHQRSCCNESMLFCFSYNSVTVHALL